MSGKVFKLTLQQEAYNKCILEAKAVARYLLIHCIPNFGVQVGQESVRPA